MRKKWKHTNLSAKTQSFRNIEYALWKAKKTKTVATNFACYYETRQLHKIWPGKNRRKDLITIFTSNATEVGLEEQAVLFGRRESTQNQMTEITRLTIGEVKAAIFKHEESSKKYHLITTSYRSNFEGTIPIRFN
jgi:hypothetical protein